MKIHNVEQGSDAWRSIRAGKPCASEYSRIITSDGTRSKSFSGYAMTLAGELFAGKPLDGFEGNGWTDRGKEMEAEAIAYYEFVRDVKLEKVGFVTDDAEQYGCSPDSFVSDDGLVEIKALKAENHVKAILYWQKHGKCPTDYIQQTQGQMMITGRKWCDLVFYNADIKPLIIRQYPILAVQDALAVEIPALIKERDVILSVLRRHAEAA